LVGSKVKGERGRVVGPFLISRSSLRQRGDIEQAKEKIGGDWRRYYGRVKGQEETYIIFSFHVAAYQFNNLSQGTSKLQENKLNFWGRHVHTLLVNVEKTQFRCDALEDLKLIKFDDQEYIEEVLFGVDVQIDHQERTEVSENEKENDEVIEELRDIVDPRRCRRGHAERNRNQEPSNFGI